MGDQLEHVSPKSHSGDDEAMVPGSLVNPDVQGAGDYPRLVFVLGAPRSGTSWFQSTLASLPHAATSPELHYSAEVLRPVLQAWRYRVTGMAPVLEALRTGADTPDRLIGLPASLEEEDLLAMLQFPIQQIVLSAIKDDPDLRIFVAKTPSDSLLTPYIRTVFPEARFVHIVRDPRKTVRSLLQASRSWGGSWAPRSAIVASLIWRAHVLGAREAAEVGDRYLELRYEDIRADLPGQLHRVTQMLGLPDEGVRTPDAHQVLSSAVTAVLGEPELREPPGFGDGTPSRIPLGPFKVWLVEWVCGDVMTEVGYELRFPTARRLHPIAQGVFDLAVRSLNRRQKEYVALNLGEFRILSRLRRPRSARSG